MSWSNLSGFRAGDPDRTSHKNAPPCLFQQALLHSIGIQLGLPTVCLPRSWCPCKLPRRFSFVFFHFLVAQLICKLLLEVAENLILENGGKKIKQNKKARSKQKTPEIQLPTSKAEEASCCQWSFSRSKCEASNW